METLTEKIVEIKTCKNCSKTFPILEKDLKFYKQFDVPPPTHCPDCRAQRRLAWRNEWKLYKRKCDKTGRDIISYISPDKPMPVWHFNEWFKDDWDRFKYGQDFDFNRPFFEQFKELVNKTQNISVLIGDCENCEYTNFSWKNKNCYLIAASDFNEDCMYLGYAFHSRDCIDCFFIKDSELLYECVDCQRCYDSNNLKQCKDSRNCYYCENCVGCSDCIGCINLRKQEFCIFNQKFSKEEYIKRKEELLKNLQRIEKPLSELRLKEPVKALFMSKCEDSIGNNLLNCKNAYHCFDLIESEDCRYVSYGEGTRDSMDINGAPHCELTYEMAGSPECYMVRLGSACWVKPSSYLTYCHLCRACSHCFSCVSLHQNKFCILNKQYKEEEYNHLLPKIIEHMKNTGEWGQFFPSSISPWCYNETSAQDYYPLKKEEALKKGYKWK